MRLFRNDEEEIVDVEKKINKKRTVENNNDKNNDHNIDFDVIVTEEKKTEETETLQSVYRSVRNKVLQYT